MLCFSHTCCERLIRDLLGVYGVVMPTVCHAASTRAPPNNQRRRGLQIRTIRWPRGRHHVPQPRRTLPQAAFDNFLAALLLVVQCMTRLRRQSHGLERSTAAFREGTNAPVTSDPREKSLRPWPRCHARTGDQGQILTTQVGTPGASTVKNQKPKFQQRTRKK